VEGEGGTELGILASEKGEINCIKTYYVSTQKTKKYAFKTQTV
jgi:hypothetical protein